MSQTIRFTKMQGAGNDYIYVNTMQHALDNPRQVAIQWSDRHRGIGGDGLVLIGKSPVPEADYTMRIFNADGSEAMMCGNASRCIGKYLYDKRITQERQIRLLTLSGVKTLELHVRDQQVDAVTVDMLQPSFVNRDLFVGTTDARVLTELTVDGQHYHGTFVSMGNPHFVVFISDILAVDVAHAGARLECHELFPSRCNIEFAQIMSNGDIRTRVWERGSGITMACGTGACATAVAAAYRNLAGRKSRIVMDGGTLEIEWRQTDNHVYMTGPAAFSFEGEINLP